MATVQVRDVTGEVLEEREALEHIEWQRQLEEA
jgi:hypothetical protein